jgi:hypothetical protein
LGSLERESLAFRAGGRNPFQGVESREQVRRAG